MANPRVTYYHLVLLPICLLTTVMLQVVISAENLVQLPIIVSPIHYRLTLLPILEDDSRLCGHVWIDVKARSETNIILLHSSELKILKTIVLPLSPDINERATQYRSEDDVAVENLCFNSAVYHDSAMAHSNIALDHHLDGQKQYLSIVLGESLKKGAYYRIGLLYTGNIYEDNTGFFRAKYEAGGETDCCKRYVLVYFVNNPDDNQFGTHWIYRTVAATQLEAIQGILSLYNLCPEW
jgi:hypothetical protein